MGRRFVPYPSSATDEIVERWAQAHGIDMRRDVFSYRITRGVGEKPTIELTMHFDDEPATPEKGADDA